MQIRSMKATFGKLEQAELTLHPGLNVIYAPNESGKSTWSHFIRNMLYGLNTRDRGELADKNRYAPWSGSAMQGRMDIAEGTDRYTLLRETKRANAPMGAFSCHYADTAIAVPGITAQNAGEMLLGVSREVFERSAFIAQAALAVDQDAELERRIAALITTGEEDVSYSETYDRLKKQLNRRKHNATGQIPALDREIAGLDAALEELRDLQAQYRRTTEQLTLSRQQMEHLQSMQQQWDALARQAQWAQFEEAEQAAAEAQRRAEALAELTGALPDAARLASLEGQCAAAVATERRIETLQAEAEAAAERQRIAAAACSAHTLYPADEAALQRKIAEMKPPAVPGRGVLWACIFAAVILSAAALVVKATPWAILPAVPGGCAAVAAAALAMARRRRLNAAKAVQEARELLIGQMEEYLPLCRQAADAAADADAKREVVSAMRRQQQEGTSALLDALRVYRPDVSGLSGAQTALQELRRHTDTLSQARQAARDTALRCELLRQNLPEKPEDNAPATPPALSRAQVEAALPQAMANVQAAQSRLDTLGGQLRAMGDPDDLSNLRRQKAEQREHLQWEYDAIVMAMDALSDANLTLQNRFSPALGARAAEIFSSITGGRYQKVLLSRDFSLAAEPARDAALRSVRLLSQGASDQLYLSVRLAICDMVLPGSPSVPLILDDALVSFDDARLHATLDYFVAESARRQILLFTCQTREGAYLSARENVNLLSL